MLNKKILLADNEQDLVYAVKLLLESKGYDVLVANDGQEALKIARKENPHLMILDVMLPKMDGYKVCRMLKFDKKYKHIPVLIFTARVQHDDEKIAYEVGADDYLAKPFDQNIFLNKILNLVK